MSYSKNLNKFSANEVVKVNNTCEFRKLRNKLGLIVAGGVDYYWTTFSLYDDLGGTFFRLEEHEIDKIDQLDDNVILFRLSLL